MIAVLVKPYTGLDQRYFVVAFPRPPEDPKFPEGGRRERRRGASPETQKSPTRRTGLVEIRGARRSIRERRNPSRRSTRERGKINERPVGNLADLSEDRRLLSSADSALYLRSWRSLATSRPASYPLTRSSRTPLRATKDHRGQPPNSPAFADRYIFILFIFSRNRMDKHSARTFSIFRLLIAGILHGASITIRGYSLALRIPVSLESSFSRHLR